MAANQPIFSDLSAEGFAEEDQSNSAAEPTEIESMCVNCGENVRDMRSVKFLPNTYRTIKNT